MQLDVPPDEAVAKPRSRRSFIFLGALAAAFAPRRVVAQAITRRPAKSVAPTGRFRTVAQMEVPPIPPAWRDNLTRLLRRATYATTAVELTAARKTGYQGWLSQQLKYSRIEDAAVNAAVAAQFPLLSQTVDQLFAVSSDSVRGQLQQATLYRAAFSKRQLYERMVEFWSDHFNISFPQVNYLKLIDDRDVIRRHALGKFPDLLKASAHSPAMLEYLDNTRNRQRTLNENYAREIMELHTMGADGGYTQTDVRELARVLTGWTLSGRGVFSFDPNGHDFATKTVLGQVLAAMPTGAGVAAKAEGDQMLDLLVKHPSTARYVSKKLLRWLLQYDPTPAQIAAVAAVYTKTQGDIPAMVRAVLSPVNVAAATPKFKRPYTFMLSALRAVKPQVSKVATIADRYLRLLGQPMFYWDPPDGYPDKADYWAGGVLQRWNFAVYLTNTSGEITMDINRFIAVNTPEGVTTAINTEVFGGEMPEKLKGQLLAYLQTQPAPPVARVREAIALALSSSTFQWL